MTDPEAILKLYTERSDSLDASSYDVAGLCRELIACRAFVIAVIYTAALDGYIDDDDIKSFGVEHGLLIEAEVTESCGQGCMCEEAGAFPMTCFKKTAVLK